MNLYICFKQQQQIPVNVQTTIQQRREGAAVG